MVVVYPHPYHPETCANCSKHESEDGLINDYFLCTNEKYTRLSVFIPLCSRCFKRLKKGSIYDAITSIIVAIAAIASFAIFTYWRWQEGRISTWGILVAIIIAAILKFLFTFVRSFLFGNDTMPKVESLEEAQILDRWGWEQYVAGSSISVPEHGEVVLGDTAEDVEESLESIGLTFSEPEDMVDYPAFIEELSSTGCEIYIIDKEQDNALAKT